MTQENALRLFIATPMFGGSCNSTYALSMIQTPQTLSKFGIETHFYFHQNDAVITKARNFLAHEFLKSDCSHLLFIDADIGFNPYDIVSMLQANKDVICGIYSKKKINWQAVSKAAKNNVPDDNLQFYSGDFNACLLNNALTQEVEITNPVEIQEAGAGFMLITRSVIETIAKDSAVFFDDRTEISSDSEMIKEIFSTYIDKEEKLHYSEDFNFCRQARACGFSIWAAPWIRLIHQGNYNFVGTWAK